MLKTVAFELSQFEPHSTIINIGATPEGIGAAYEIAKQMGFETTGIVSSQAEVYGAHFSEHADRIYVIKDALWGGIDPKTKELSPTSVAMVGVSHKIIAFGGGEVGADEIEAAHKMKISVAFYDFQFNHDIAIRKASSKGLARPTDFVGAASIRMRAMLSEKVDYCHTLFGPSVR